MEPLKMKCGKEGLNNLKKSMACSCDLQRHKERSSPDQTDLDLTSTLIHTVDRSGRYLGMGVVVCVYGEDECRRCV